MSLGVLQRRQRSHGGFTLIELLLVIGIIAVLASIVILSINPRKQLMNAYDAARRGGVSAIEKAMSQYAIDNNGSMPSGLGIPSGLANAKYVCRANVLSSNCINLEVLAPTYLASVPLDSTEPCRYFSGFKIYLDGTFLRASAANLGLASGQITQDPSCSSTIMSSMKMWLKTEGISGASDGTVLSSWADVSGNNNTPTQGNASLKPILRTNLVNSRPAVEFYGKYLDAPIAFDNVQTYAVLNSPTATFNNYGSALGNAPGYARAFMFEPAQTYFHSNPFPNGVRKNGTVLSSPFDLSPITSFMLLGVDTSNSGTNRLYQVGGFETSYTASINIAEVMAFNSLLSTADRGIVETYFNLKYRLY